MHTYFAQLTAKLELKAIRIRSLFTDIRGTLFQMFEIISKCQNYQKIKKKSNYQNYIKKYYLSLRLGPECVNAFYLPPK